MRVKFSKEQMGVLSKHKDMFDRMNDGTFRGSVLSVVKRELADIYDSVASGRCSVCNDRWIYRLAVWFQENLDAKPKSKPKKKPRATKKPTSE